MFGKIFPIGRRGQVVVGLLLLLVLLFVFFAPAICYGQGAETPQPMPTPITAKGPVEAAELAKARMESTVQGLVLVTLTRAAFGWLDEQVQQPPPEPKDAAAAITARSTIAAKTTLLFFSILGVAVIAMLIAEKFFPPECWDQENED